MKRTWEFPKNTNQYPLVICCIAIEHGPLIVDLPMKDGDFPVRFLCWFTRPGILERQKTSEDCSSESKPWYLVAHPT